MPAGFIYVLVNPTIANLAKVGKTTRDPAKRVAELSGATGVASPFILIYQQPVSDCDRAEAWIHATLTARGWRHAENREFFSAPLHEIVATVAEAAGREIEPVAATLQTEARAGQPDGAGEIHEEPASEGDELCLLALQMLLGADGTLADRPRAALLMQQAADLGSIEACRVAADLLMRDEHGIPKDLHKAHRYLSRAIDAGATECHALMAELFLMNGQRPMADEHWDYFFSHTAWRIISSQPDSPLHRESARAAGSEGRTYCKLVYTGRLDDTIDDSIFYILAPFIERAYNADRMRWTGIAPAARTGLEIPLDLEMRFMRDKQRRGADLPPWRPRPSHAA